MTAPTTVESLGQIFAHGPGRHLQAELQQQLIGDPFLAPRWVLPGHPTDKRLQVRRHRRSSRTWMSTARTGEPLAMPAGQGRRLNNGQRPPPVEPAGEPDQSHPGGIGGSSWFDVALLIQGQLLTQKEVLRGEGGTRA